MPKRSLPDAMFDLLGIVQGGAEEAIQRWRQSRPANLSIEKRRAEAVVFDESASQEIAGPTPPTRPRIRRLHELRSRVRHDQLEAGHVYQERSKRHPHAPDHKHACPRTEAQHPGPRAAELQECAADEQVQRGRFVQVEVPPYAPAEILTLHLED